MKTRLSTILILGGCLLGAGAYSLYRGQDANWDLKNYHYYVAFALLNGRMGWDLAPAQLQTYFNPLLDLPFYFLIDCCNGTPRLVSALMAVPAGVAIFFLVKLALHLFGASRHRYVLLGFALFMGVSGAAGISQWGTTMNEWPVAALDMIAVYVLVKALSAGALNARSTVLAGALCGVAAGLKLTAATAAVAAFAALFFPRRPLSERTTAAATFGAAVAIGFLLTAGPWMWNLYERFGNPLFPLFNDVFRSPWAEPSAISNSRFVPTTLLDALVFPFHMLHKSSVASEPYLRDWHLPMLYAAGILAACARGLALHPRHRQRWTALDDTERFLLAYALFSYVVWLGLHSIYRYLVHLELISGCVLVILLRRIVPRAGLTPVLAAVLIATWATKVNASWGRIGYGERYFDVSVPELPRNALVLLPSGEPMAYLVPFFPRDARFVGVRNSLVRPDGNSLLERKIRALVAARPGDIYVLDHAGGEGLPVLAAYGLRAEPGQCLPLRSNMDPGGITICPVVRGNAAGPDGKMSP